MDGHQCVSRERQRQVLQATAAAAEAVAASTTTPVLLSPVRGHSLQVIEIETCATKPFALELGGARGVASTATERDSAQAAGLDEIAASEADDKTILVSADEGVGDPHQQRASSTAAGGQSTKSSEVDHTASIVNKDTLVIAEGQQSGTGDEF